MSKSKRPQSRTRSTASTNDHIHHLHVVIDDELHEKIEEHARKLEVRARKPEKRARKPESVLVPKSTKTPNLSAAVRDLLRSKLGLPAVEAA